LAIDPMRSKDYDRLMVYLDDQIRLYRNRPAVRQEEVDQDPFGEGFHIGYETALTHARTEAKGKTLDQFVIYARRRAIEAKRSDAGHTFLGGFFDGVWEAFDEMKGWI
jgi:hypothetical protein